MVHGISSCSLFRSIRTHGVCSYLPVRNKVDGFSDRGHRPRSSQETDTSKSKRYSNTLNLPKTALVLSMKDGASLKRESSLQKGATFQSLYKWQQTQNWSKSFVLHDGPPYANGNLHVGHAVNKVLKDITNRYKLMMKHKIHYVPGWDCHGMPIEIKAVTDNAVNQEKSPLKVRAKAKAYAETTLKKQKSSFERLGVMADWNDIYKTMNPQYEAKQLKVFYKIFEKGYMYRDYMPVYWSPSSITALAEAELEYNPDHISKSVVVQFPLTSPSTAVIKAVGKSAPVVAVVWTTTPWTLPFNQAICYNPKIRYSLLQSSQDQKILLCEEAYVDHLKSIVQHDLQTVSTIDGADLEGSTYQNVVSSQELPFLPAAHVASGKGTGLVHTAPAHGHDDFAIAVKHNLPKECHVDENGTYVSGVPDNLLGKTVGVDAEEAVLHLLESWILSVEDYTHSYPYDWRTKKPVIIRASKQWFIDTVALRQRALESLNQVEIIPPQSEKGMQVEINSRPYWCISRQRYWGVPIPVFYHKISGEPLITKETVDHICNLVLHKGSDCWWELPLSELLPDQLLKQIDKGESEEYVKGEDILDIWFDSGTSWAAVLEDFKNQADVYLEGIDQYKGWFQTSLLSSVAVNNKAPYRRIITHGFATDEEGRKMSKSIGNIVDPEDVIEGGKDRRKFPSYGVDVLRWWVAHSHHHQQIMIGPSILQQMNEDVFKLRKTLRHLLGNLHGFDPETECVPYQDLTALDKYLLFVLYSTIAQINHSYENVSYHRVVQQLEKFVNADLSSFYISNTRDRCYCEASGSLKRKSSQTVQYHVVRLLNAAIAPILPHLSEEVHQHLPGKHMSDSDQDSVFKCGAIKMDYAWSNPKAYKNLVAVFDMRRLVLDEIDVENPVEFDASIYSSPKLHDLLKEIQPEETSSTSTLCELLQTSQVTILDKAPPVIPDDAFVIHGTAVIHGSSGTSGSQVDYKILITSSAENLCVRCRRYTAKKSGSPCDRCLGAIAHEWSA